MTVSDKTLLETFTRAEARERKRMEERADRLARRLDGGIPSGPATEESFYRGLEAATKASRDGVRAVARKTHKVIKADDTPAVEWADRKDQKGELVKLYCTGSSAATRKQAVTRAAIRDADSKADARKAFRKMAKRCERGGDIWSRCRNRAAKRALRAKLNNATKLAEAGDHRSALMVLRDQDH